MAADSDSTLMKVAIFGIAMSIVCTAMISVMMLDNRGDYDYDQISSYRDELSDFTGESMLNTTPWVLQHVYTPWVPSMGTEGHIDDDRWLYGEEIADYEYIGRSADIQLDPAQKSGVPITVSDDQEPYRYATGVKWWASDAGKWYSGVTGYLGSDILGLEPKTYAEGTATIWNYTGYRYVFDPTLPFEYDEAGEPVTSVRDGALSLVWYNYAGTEGLSGGLDVYGGRVLLASYTAADIISAYNTASGYATTYDFDFEGTKLQLSVRFAQDVLEAGTSLMQAWTQGDWSLAISSISAGNFYDLENSTSFTTTAGSMIKTFIQIFTFSLPEVDNPWINWVLWMLCGLPMCMAMLFVTLRLIGAVKIL